jgi:hypothetical protein
VRLPLPDAQYDAAAASAGAGGAGAAGGIAVDVVRSALRALDGLLKAVPAIAASHKRVAAYMTAVET